jgi:hypothetical protein
MYALCGCSFDRCSAMTVMPGTMQLVPAVQVVPINWPWLSSTVDVYDGRTRICARVSLNVNAP